MLVGNLAVALKASILHGSTPLLSLRLQAVHESRYPNIQHPTCENTNQQTQPNLPKFSADALSLQNLQLLGQAVCLLRLGPRLQHPF